MGSLRVSSEITHNANFEENAMLKVSEQTHSNAFRVSETKREREKKRMIRNAHKAMTGIWQHPLSGQNFSTPSGNTLETCQAELGDLFWRLYLGDLGLVFRGLR